jgi:hypothetical protein
MVNDGGYRIVGPDVAVISWIPYAYDFADMVPNAFSGHRRRHGFQMLFDSGNPTPPEAFTGHDDFLAFLETKEFRGAMCLRDVVLGCSEEGTPLDLQWTRAEMFVGHTPYRYGNSVQRRKFTLRYAKGQKNEMTDAMTGIDSSAVHLTRSFFFRVGQLGNLASWILTRSAAPWVGATIDYEIDGHGSVKVQFGGSWIPSHRVYVDWKAVGGHDMLDGSASEIDQFMNTGRDGYAPGGLFADWKGQGRRAYNGSGRTDR